MQKTAGHTHMINECDTEAQREDYANDPKALFELKLCRVHHEHAFVPALHLKMHASRGKVVKPEAVVQKKLNPGVAGYVAPTVR